MSPAERQAGPPATAALPVPGSQPATMPSSPAGPTAALGPGSEPAAGNTAAEAAEPPPPGRTSGLPVSLITGIVLAAAALVVLVALAIPLLLQQLGSDPEPPYAVGDCVVQDGTSAIPATCDEPGAFQVVEEVERIEDCPDYPAQHAITVSEPAAVFCVSPVEAPDVEG